LKFFFVNIHYGLQNKNQSDFSVFPVDTHLTSGQYIFSLLLNADWVIQVLEALAVCKASLAS